MFSNGFPHGANSIPFARERSRQFSGLLTGRTFLLCSFRTRCATPVLQRGKRDPAELLTRSAVLETKFQFSFDGRNETRHTVRGSSAGGGVAWQDNNFQHGPVDECSNVSQCHIDDCAGDDGGVDLGMWGMFPACKRDKSR